MITFSFRLSHASVGLAGLFQELPHAGFGCQASGRRWSPCVHPWNYTDLKPFLFTFSRSSRDFSIFRSWKSEMDSWTVEHSTTAAWMEFSFSSGVSDLVLRRLLESIDGIRRALSSYFVHVRVCKWRNKEGRVSEWEGALEVWGWLIWGACEWVSCWMGSCWDCFRGWGRWDSSWDWRCRYSSWVFFFGGILLAGLVGAGVGVFFDLVGQSFLTLPSPVSLFEFWVTFIGMSLLV